jgi:hypothetical protein
LRDDALQWTQPLLLQRLDEGTHAKQEIASLVAFDSHIGVMWSNQAASAMYFATHADRAPDSEWGLEIALRAPGYADDHINLTTDGEGRVYAVTKTSLNDNDRATGQEPLILLLVRDRTNGWQSHTVSTVADNLTRPAVLIDMQHRTLLVLAAGPGSSGGSIYLKRSSIDDILFVPGVGEPFIQSSGDTHINNVSSTKQRLDSASGLVAIASDDHSKFYLHNTLDLSADAH